MRLIAAAAARLLREALPHVQFAAADAVLAAYSVPGLAGLWR